MVVYFYQVVGIECVLFVVVVVFVVGVAVVVVVVVVFVVSFIGSIPKMKVKSRSFLI